MKTINRFKLLGSAMALPILLAFSAHGFAQTTMSQTTLAGSVTANNPYQTTVNLASATGIVQALNGQPVTILYVDTEAMGDMTLQTGQTTIYSVQRALYGTIAEPHAANAVVYFQVVTPQSGGYTGGLQQRDPPAQANCTTANQLVLPWINMTTGQQWNCQSHYTPAGNIATGTWLPMSKPGAPDQGSPTTVWSVAAYSNATTTLSNITGLTFYVPANKNVVATCHITWSSSNTAAAPSYAFTGPTSPTAVTTSLWSPVTASTFTTASGTAYATALANAATVTTSTNFTDILTVSTVNAGNPGFVQVRMKSTSASGTVTVQPGSYCQVQ